MWHPHSPLRLKRCRAVERGGGALGLFARLVAPHEFVRHGQPLHAGVLLPLVGRHRGRHCRLQEVRPPISEFEISHSGRRFGRQDFRERSCGDVGVTRTRKISKVLTAVTIHGTLKKHPQQCSRQHTPPYTTGESGADSEKHTHTISVRSGAGRHEQAGGRTGAAARPGGPGCWSCCCGRCCWRGGSSAVAWAYFSGVQTVTVRDA